MGVVASSSKPPFFLPIMKPSLSVVVVLALLTVVGPFLVTSLASFSAVTHPPTVSSTHECLLADNSPTQNLTDTLAILGAGIPPLKPQENCDTTEKLFQDYPNVQLAYFNASLIFPPTVLPMDVVENCTQNTTQLANDADFMAILKETIDRLAFRGASCADIAEKYPTAHSGFYIIKDGNGEDVTIYCDMDGSNCDEHPGWMRIGLIDMTIPGGKCPEGLKNIKSSTRSYCGRSTTGAGCASVLYDSLGHNYTRVCGRARALQHGSTKAFFYGGSESQTLDGWYVDGISVTHGVPRNHLWTYAAGISESQMEETSCPCNQGFTNSSFPPSFVHEDYYCESGNSEATVTDNKLYSFDNLWNRKECNGLEELCCVDPKMPWFTKPIGQTTQDSIEIRVCSHGMGTMGVYIEQLEILVR